MSHTSGSIRIVSLVLFTGFSIPVSIVAMVQFWPAGIALAAFLGWQLTRIAGVGLEPQIKDLLPDRATETSGNASFDAHRADLLKRLEIERIEFQDFLDRLRTAKDQIEFDRFMKARSIA
ncbi:MAG: DUF2852 domain-containing protein [Pseudomonadota bacterium]